MSATIIFGTKRLGKVVVESATKYPELAVVTVEGVKAAKKSRRVLFNKMAAEMLGLEGGTIQNLVFASVETGENEGRQVLIADSSTMEPEAIADMVTYKTSKNAVAFEDTKEKGKAVTSSHICGEILSFLDKDETSNIEFQLVGFDNPGLDAFSLESMNAVSVVSQDNGQTTPAVDSVEEVVAEDNNGNELTGQDVAESVQNEVAKAEAANPVISEGLPIRAGGVAEAVTEDWMEN